MQKKNIWAWWFRNLWTTLWSTKACLIMRDKENRMQNIIPISFVFCLGTTFGSQIGETNNKHWQLYLSTIHAVITLEHFSCIFILNPNQDFFFSPILITVLGNNLINVQLLKFSKTNMLKNLYTSKILNCWFIYLF